jgi:hypothetical protein
MTDLPIKDSAFHEKRTRQKFLESRNQSFNCLQCVNFEEHVSSDLDSLAASTISTIPYSYTDQPSEAHLFLVTCPLSILSYPCCLFFLQFKKYRRERILRDKIANLEEKSSIEMLSLIPEYRNRVGVYILSIFSNINP